VRVFADVCLEARGVAQRALPEGRYGSRARRPVPKWLRWLLVGVVLLAGVGIAAVAYENLGTKPIEAKQTAFEVLDDSSVRVTFQVVRDHPDQPAVCIIRARADDGDEVGRREVLIPSGKSAVNQTTVLRTSKRPITGEVFGCSYQVPPYLSTR
jgi:hypothetical protein